MDIRRFSSQCINNLFGKVFVTSPGGSYSDPVSYSHYNQPLEEGGYRGYSRRWGDASYLVQLTAMNEIVQVGREQKLSDQELAFLLSVARVESGFNPDAAAGTTSASGIGQIIDKTREGLGIKNFEKFDLKENAKGFVTLLGSLLKNAKRELPKSSQSRVFERAYGLYHDGPSLSYGGEAIGRNKVNPQIGTMKAFLECFSGEVTH